jgi:hypothetical protein
VILARLWSGTQLAKELAHVLADLFFPTLVNDVSGPQRLLL